MPEQNPASKTPILKDKIVPKKRPQAIKKKVDKIPLWKQEPPSADDKEKLYEWKERAN